MEEDLQRTRGKIQPGQRMPSPAPPYNISMPQAIGGGGGGYTLPQTTYPNIIMYQAPGPQRPLSAPGVSQPPPIHVPQKRETKLLEIFDPNTGKNILSDNNTQQRSTPPGSSGSGGSRGQTPNETMDSLPPQDNAIATQFDAEVAAAIRNPWLGMHPSNMVISDVPPPAVLTQSHVQPVLSTQIQPGQRMPSPAPPYNISMPQAIGGGGGGYTLPQTTYPNTIMYQAPGPQRPLSAPGVSQPQPIPQKREQKVLEIVDPYTVKNILSNYKKQQRSTPPGSSGSGGSRGQTPNETMDSLPPHDNAITAQFAAQFAAAMMNLSPGTHPSNMIISDVPPPAVLTQTHVQPVLVKDASSSVDQLPEPEPTAGGEPRETIEVLMASSSTVFCGPCEAQDIAKQADHWCPECEEGLCNDCQKHHSVSKASRGHGIISVENYKKLPTTISEVVHHCKEHNMRHQHYCVQHDQICCPVCISTNHKKCTDLMAISEIVKTSKTSSLLANIEESLQDIKNNIDQVIKNRYQNLSTIKDQRERCIDEVKQTRIKINSHLDMLEKKIINELLAAEREAKEQIDNLLTQICKTGLEVNELQKSVLAVKEYASDLQTFFGSKAIEAEVDKMEKYMTSLQEDGRLQELNLKFAIDEKVSSMISNFRKFGTVSVAASPPSVVLKTEKEKQAQIIAVIQQPSPKTIHNIKVSLASKYELPKGEYTSDVRGCVGLPNGKFIFADCSRNKRLIIMNSDCSFDKAIHLPGQGPYDVTSIHDTLVAVSTYGGIKVINLDAADKPIKSIKTADTQNGVTNIKGKILWCEQSIGIRETHMEKSGDGITTLVKDDGVPQWSYITACGDNIYTTNPENSTITCYQNKKKFWDFKNATTCKDPEGVTVDNHRNVFVTSFRDSRVAVISPDGEQGRLLLTAKDGITNPWGIFFDKVRETLIVATKNGTVFVYNIS